MLIAGCVRWSAGRRRELEMLMAGSGGQREYLAENYCCMWWQGKWKSSRLVLASRMSGSALGWLPAPKPPKEWLQHCATEAIGRSPTRQTHSVHRRPAKMMIMTYTDGCQQECGHSGSGKVWLSLSGCLTLQSHLMLRKSSVSTIFNISGMCGG